MKKTEIARIDDTGSGLSMRAWNVMRDKLWTDGTKHQNYVFGGTPLDGMLAVKAGATAPVGKGWRPLTYAEMDQLNRDLIARSPFEHQEKGNPSRPGAPERLWHARTLRQRISCWIDGIIARLASAIAERVQS